MEPLSRFGLRFGNSRLRGPALAFALLACLPPQTIAAPGDVLFSDDFSSGNLSQWQKSAANSSSTTSGVSGFDVDTGQSAFLRAGQNLTRPRRWRSTIPGISRRWMGQSFDSGSAGARNQSNPNSESPEGGEDLVVQYKESNDNWVTAPTRLDVHEGGSRSPLSARRKTGARWLSVASTTRCGV